MLGGSDPWNLGEGKSARLSSWGVCPGLRAVAQVAPLARLWRPPGRKELQNGPIFVGSRLGAEGAGVSWEPGEPRLRMEQRQIFTPGGEGEWGSHDTPSLPLPTL